MKLRAALMSLILALAPGVPALADDLKPWEAEGCDIEKVDLNLEPEALVMAFLERDSKGEFLSSGDWLPKAVVCPGFLGGPDTSTVVLGYTVAKRSETAESVAFEVSYQVIGILTPGGDDGDMNAFEPGVATHKEVFTAVKTPHGWKLGEFAWPKISPAAVSKHFSHRKWVAGAEAEFKKAAGQK